MDLKIQYSENTPLVDFEVFLNGEDSCGILHKEILDGCKNKAFKDLGQSYCYTVLWRYAINFAASQLKGWDGYTLSWYVMEFFKRCGFVYEKTDKGLRVYYDNKPI